MRQANGLAVLVLHRHLGLAIGAQVRHGAGLANLAEALGQAVRHPDRHRHEVRGLVAGVAEHHALVAGALLVELVLFAGGARTHLFGVVDALSDVDRLLIDGDEHAAGGAVVADVLAVVADVADRLAHDRLDVDVGLGGDFAGDDRQAGGHHRLAGHPGVGILLEQGVEHRVRDLVGHLVGMTFGHRLRRKCPLGHVELLKG